MSLVRPQGAGAPVVAEARERDVAQLGLPTDTTAHQSAERAARTRPTAEAILTGAYTAEPHPAHQSPRPDAKSALEAIRLGAQFGHPFVAAEDLPRDVHGPLLRWLRAVHPRHRERFGKPDGPDLGQVFLALLRSPPGFRTAAERATTAA